MPQGTEITCSGSGADQSLGCSVSLKVQRDWSLVTEERVT